MVLDWSFIKKKNPIVSNMPAHLLKMAVLSKKGIFLNANWTIFQLYVCNDENKLHFDEVMMMSMFF